jgi:alpha-N-arabinofuranosidase
MHITLVNLDPLHSVPVSFAAKFYRGEFKGSATKGQVLTSGRYTDVNTFSQPDRVKIQNFTDFGRVGDRMVVHLPPKSVVMLETQKMW